MKKATNTQEGFRKVMPGIPGKVVKGSKNRGLFPDLSKQQYSCQIHTAPCQEMAVLSLERVDRIGGGGVPSSSGRIEMLLRPTVFSPEVPEPSQPSFPCCQGQGEGVVTTDTRQTYKLNLRLYLFLRCSIQVTAQGSLSTLVKDNLESEQEIRRQLGRKTLL